MPASDRLRFLGMLIDAVEQSVIATDRDGIIVYWNRFAETLYGWSAAEVLGTKLQDVLVPASSVEHARRIMATVAAGAGWSGEFALKRRDGSELWVHASSTSIVDEDKAVIGFVGLSSDITDKRRLESELRERSTHLALLAHKIPIIAWSTDTSLRVLAQWGGISFPGEMDLSRIIGSTIDDLVRDGIASPQALDVHRRALAGETASYVGAKGGVHWQSIVHPRRDDTGAIDGALGVSLDITETVRAHEALEKSQRQLLEAQAIGRVGCWEYDVVTGVVTGSEQAFRIFGMEPQEELRFDPSSELVHPDDRARRIAHFAAQIAGTATTVDDTFRIIGADGKPRVVHSRSAPICDENGRVVRIVGTSQDVTERDRAEKQLLGLSRRNLEAQEAERRAVARELHDDLGQGLTAIRLQLERAARGMSAADAKQVSLCVELVDEAIGRVRTLALELRPSSLDDLGLVPALRSLLARQTQRAGLASVFSADALDARLAPDVETCCFRIAQEALTNVVRHSKATNVELRVHATESEIEIVISDDGCGFDVSPEHDRGAHLGLLGMRERATLLGGRLEIISERERGTKVRAIVPLRSAAEAPR